MNEVSNINNVFLTPFYLELHQMQLEISDNFSSRVGYIEGKNNNHLLNEQEKRSTRIFRLSSNLGSILNDIRLCYLFMNKSLNKQYLEQNEISELDYIRYHYEVFIHKVHTITEIMKLLCNETLDLGISIKKCSWKNLMSYKKFKDSESKKIIERNFNYFEHLIHDRHLNSHRGILEDEKIDEFSPLYFIYRYSKKFDYPLDEKLSEFLSPGFIKYKIHELKKTKVQELKKHEQVLLKDVHDFFMSLQLAPNGS